MNPFVFGRVVSRADYCGRPELEARLKARLLAGQNTYMEGERRTGKTSLAVETIKRLKSRRMVYIDLLEVRTVEDIHKRTLSGIVKAEGDAGVLQSLLKGVSSLRPAITFDPLTGSPSVSIEAATGLKPESLEGLLDIFSRKEYRNCVVVMDEFQDVLNLGDHRKVLAVMRGRIQFLQSIPIVFCGSIRGKMNQIFIDPDSPFFKSALPIEVGPIDRAVFRDFISRKFSGVKVGISPVMIDRIIGIAAENPGDTQQLCAAVCDVAKPREKVDDTVLAESMQRIYAEERKGYEACLARITAIQLKCLVAVARLGGKNTLAKEFLAATGVRQPSSVQKALARLEDLKVIFKSGHEYRYVNPFFAHWLVWMNY